MMVAAERDAFGPPLPSGYTTQPKSSFREQVGPFAHAFFELHRDFIQQHFDHFIGRDSLSLRGEGRH